MSWNLARGPLYYSLEGPHAIHPCFAIPVPETEVVNNLHWFERSELERIFLSNNTRPVITKITLKVSL